MPHTPGPWTVTRMAEHPVTKEEFLAWVGECWDKTTEVTDGVGVPLIVRQNIEGPVVAILGPGSDRYVANADGIAAYPDLLDACRELTRTIYDVSSLLDDYDEPLSDRALRAYERGEDAIRKAEGPPAS